MDDATQKVHLGRALLLVGLAGLLVTVVAAFARDIESQGDVGPGRPTGASA